MKSGRWHWTSVPGDDGDIVTLKHTGRHRDEMKTWMQPTDAGGVLEAARHPVYRTWEDYDGVAWLTGIEFASLREDSAVWITFRNAICELSAPMPRDTGLGDLTADELATLLKSAL